MKEKIQLLLRLISTILLIWHASTGFAKTYPLPQDGADIIGQNIKINVQEGDTLEEIASRYGLSFHELLEANQNIDGGNLHPEQELLIPLMHILPSIRKGIVINLAELRLYYFPPNTNEVITYPVGLGRKGEEWRTPLGETSVLWKKAKPTWHPTKSIQAYQIKLGKEPLPSAVPPGPDNPLGEYAIYLKKPLLVIHGTNEPRSIGRFASSGCIRLYPQDIEQLYHLVEKKTPVTIINEITRAGWLNDKLYLKAQIPLSLEGLDEASQAYQNDSARKAIYQAMKGKSARVNWRKINQVLLEADGVPHEIGEAITMPSNVEDTKTAQHQQFPPYRAEIASLD